MKIQTCSSNYCHCSMSLLSLLNVWVLHIQVRNKIELRWPIFSIKSNSEIESVTCWSHLLITSYSHFLPHADHEVIWGFCIKIHNTEHNFGIPNEVIWQDYCSTVRNCPLGCAKKKKSWKVTSHNNQNLLFLTHMGIKITGTVIFNCTCTIVIILPLNLAHLSYLMQEIFQSSDTVCLSEKVFPLTSLLYALKNEN